MSPDACNQLEAYLAGGLSAGELAAFDAHLPACPPCQEAVAQQRHIDRLLRQAVGQLDLFPAALIGRIEGRMRRARRRRLLAGGAALCAVAATLLVVMIGGWHVSDGHRRIGWHVPDGHRREALVGEGRAAPSTRLTSTSPVESNSPKSGERRVHPIDHALRSSGRATPAQPRARVTMADPSSAIVVPMESNMPNVTIVWIYPTIRPQPAGSVPDTN